MSVFTAPFRWMVAKTPEHGTFTNIEVIVFSALLVVVAEIAVLVPFFFLVAPKENLHVLLYTFGVGSGVGYVFAYRYWMRVNREADAFYNQTEERIRRVQEQLNPQWSNFEL